MFNYYICLYNNACERNGNKIYLNYNTVASYTLRVPGVKADNVSSVTRVALANHRTGRQKSYINVSTFVAIRNTFTLLIRVKLFVHNKWLLNTLHHLKISLVYYNDITKKTCLIPDARSRPLIFPPKTHVVGNSRLQLRSLHTLENFGYNFNN